MLKKPLTISLVIPVYNEESHLAECLRSAVAQATPFYEIIVVDNNSTDDTAAIAAGFSDVIFAREAQQGVVYARNTGFDAATGDIIARIDADTILSPDWTIVAAELFRNDQVDAVSGMVGFTDVPFEGIFESVDLWFRKYMARHLGARNEQFLYGANMAIRRSSWQLVRSSLCDAAQFHEDMDLAAHLIHAKATILFSQGLKVAVSARRVDSSFKEYRPYVLASSRTYAAHGLAGRRYMYLPEAFALAFYAPLRILYRSYDHQTGRLSLKSLLQNVETDRVSPVAEIS